MNTIAKNKGWAIAVIGLLLINIAMLFFFLIRDNSNHGPRGGGREARMTEFLKKEVGFDAKQLQQFDSLNKQNREKMKANFDEMRNSKEKLLKDLGASAFSDSAIALAATQSAAMQKDMELHMLRHFAEIRKICTPAQQPVFDSLFYKMLSRRGENKPKTEK